MRITKLEATDGEVKLTFANGVDLHLSIHADYVHLSFGRINADDGIVATTIKGGCGNYLRSSNVLDVVYSPIRD